GFPCISNNFIWQLRQTNSPNFFQLYTPLLIYYRLNGFATPPAKRIGYVANHDGLLSSFLFLPPRCSVSLFHCSISSLNSKISSSISLTFTRGSKPTLTNLSYVSCWISKTFALSSSSVIP